MSQSLRIKIEAALKWYETHGWCQGAYTENDAGVQWVPFDNATKCCILGCVVQGGAYG